MPTIRTNLVDAYLFRRVEGNAHPELLLLRRAGEPLAGTWQPVMGHIERGETAVDCMWRELAEETDLARADAVGAWALEQVHPFFLAERDEIVMSPRFAVEVPPGWEPILNNEHDAALWVSARDTRQRFLWPGQHAAIAELLDMLRNPRRLDALRLPAD